MNLFVLARNLEALMLLQAAMVGEAVHQVLRCIATDYRSSRTNRANTRRSRKPRSKRNRARKAQSAT